MTNEERVEKILEYFDFDKVKRVMDILDWEWDMSYDPAAIPSYNHLRRTAKTLLSDVLDGNESVASFGGLVATKTDGKLSLSFVVTRSGIEGEK